jgi:glycerophosphoryl diester phosphodiesterase
MVQELYNILKAYGIETIEKSQ